MIVGVVKRVAYPAILLLLIFAVARCGPSPGGPIYIFCSPDSPRMQQAIEGLRAGLNREKLEVVCVPELGPKGEEELRRLRRQQPRLLVTLGSAALIRVAQVEKGVPVVFGLVANPYFTGAAYDPAHPEIHQGNITGVASPPPLDAALEQGAGLLPRSWGMLYDPDDGVSVELKDLFLKEAPAYGLRPQAEAGGDLASDLRGLKRLLNRGVRVIYLPGAPSAARYAPDLMAWGRERRVMVVSGHPEFHQGALLWVTLDYRKLGEETATLARWVLAGEAPDKIPLVEKTPLKIEADDRLLRYWSGYPG